MNNYIPAPFFNIEHIDIMEAATLALYVYDDADKPALPENFWLYDEYIPESDSDGYFGACFIKTADIKSENCHFKVFIVHRGTVLSYTDNIHSDIQLAQGKIPENYYKGKKYTEELILKINSDFDTGKIKLPSDENLKIKNIQVGHSLGALIAACIAPATSMKAITFENPGIKPVVTDLINKKILQPEDINYFHQSHHYNIQSNLNIINSFNEQMGITFLVQGIPFTLNGYYPDTSLVHLVAKYTGNLFYIVHHTADQHRMVNIFNALKTNFDIRECSSYYPNGYPAGPQHGYFHYLWPGYGWTAVSNKTYWDLYFENIWKNDALTRSVYKNDIDKFYSDCFNKTLNPVYVAAYKEANQNNTITQNKETNLKQFSFFEIKKPDNKLKEPNTKSAIEDESIEDFVLIEEQDKEVEQEKIETVGSRFNCLVM